MSQKIIVDGYNVIYTDDRLRRTACKDLQGARDRLMELLKRYLEERRVQVTVVFDGRGGLAEAESLVPGKLQALYSARNQTADELILATLRRSSNPKSFVVVTSDMADIGRTAMRWGCKVIGSKRFLDRLTAAMPPASSGEGRATRRDLGDTDYWLRQFNDEGGDADEPE
jgi:predicted RNA-binding protein with PIN domain